MAYDYNEEMKQDIISYINDNDILDTEWDEDTDRDALYEKLNEELWVEDSVTGNASGSYTFNTAQAREYVTQNMELCMTALDEFGTAPKTIAQKFRDGEWEWLDVSIRCYVLGSALSAALDELGIE